MTCLFVYSLYMFVFLYSWYFINCDWWYFDDDDVFIVLWHVCVCVFMSFCTLCVIDNYDDVFVFWRHNDEFDDWWHVCVFMIFCFMFVIDNDNDVFVCLWYFVLILWLIMMMMCLLFWWHVCVCVFMIFCNL